jgi:6-phosphogluconolactonase
VLLGLGPDGHTASLFPGSRALAERERDVVSNWVEKFQSHRITFTYPALDAARAVLFLVEGADKAPALRAVLEDGPFDHVPPAKLVAPASGAPLWFLDRAAAAGLKQRA